MFNETLLDKFTVGCLAVDFEIAPHGKQWMVFDPLRSSKFILIDEKTAVLLRLAKQMDKDQSNAR